MLGTDSAYFAITNGGVLSFDPAPDYEGPKDSDQNNVYHVTVQASDGNNINRLDVTVTVTNVEEAGTVELSSVQPQVDTRLDGHPGRSRRGHIGCHLVVAEVKRGR